MTPEPPGAATPQVRAVFRRALRDLLVVVVVLTVLGSGLGWLVAGSAGLWGGLLGGAVVLLVAGTTVVTMLLTARLPVATAGAIALAAWVVKAGILLVALLVLGRTDLVHRPVFGAVVVLGLVASVVVDYRAVALGRVTYVDGPPDAGRGTSPTG